MQSYGISVTTLEQVFLEIGHDPNPKPKVILGNSNEESLDLNRVEDVGIDQNETTPGGARIFTSPAKRTPGALSGGKGKSKIADVADD